LEESDGPNVKIDEIVETEELQSEDQIDMNTLILFTTKLASQGKYIQANAMYEYMLNESEHVDDLYLIHMAYGKSLIDMCSKCGILSEQKYALARFQFFNAHLNKPNKVLPYYYIAKAYAGQKMYEQAANCIQEGMEIQKLDESDDYESKYGLKFIYSYVSWYIGKRDDFIKTTNELIELEKEIPKGWVDICKKNLTTFGNITENSQITRQKVRHITLTENDLLNLIRSKMEN
jgi:tetratricopeptide (TPR) repeat protein